MGRHILLLVAGILVMGGELRGDAVRLKSGEVVVGQTVWKDANKIRIRKEDGAEIVLERSEVVQFIIGDSYKRYLERRAKVQSVKEREDLARWCRQYKFDPEAAELVREIFEERRKGAGTVRERVELARWCLAQGFGPEADGLFEEILKEDPQNPEVRRIMGMMKRAPYVKDITWSLEWDASADDFGHWKEIVRKAVEHLWKATEGQYWIRSVKLVDRSKKGEVWVDPTGEHPMTGPGQVHLARNWYSQGQHFTFVHAWGHSFFGLGDEYVAEGRNPGVPTEQICVMGNSSHAGFCDKENHTWPGKDCWSQLLEKFPKMRHPNPFSPKPPPLLVEIQDN